MNPSQHGICTTKATTSSFWSAFGSLLWSTRKAKPATAATVGITMLAGFITAYSAYTNSNSSDMHRGSIAAESIRNGSHIQPVSTSASLPMPPTAPRASTLTKKDEQEHLRTKAKAIQLLSKDKTDCNCVPLWECLQQNVGGEMEMDVDQAMTTPAVKRECGELESQLRMCMVISREYVGQTGDLRE